MGCTGLCVTLDNVKILLYFTVNIIQSFKSHFLLAILIIVKNVQPFFRVHVLNRSCIGHISELIYFQEGYTGFACQKCSNAKAYGERCSSGQSHF